MLNFTVGPVMSDPTILAIGGKSSPYFRTNEFSCRMKENEEWMLNLLHAPKDSRCVFLTTSGTGAMESCVMNLLNEKDNVLIINGGNFGQRFVDLCKLHQVKNTEIKLEFGSQIAKECLDRYENKGYTALLINMNETSSGTLYDMNLISNFCKKNNVFLIVDAISSFIADEIDMMSLHAGAIITASQKALAVHPGISIVALTKEAVDKVYENDDKCMYLSLKLALHNANRGQTPFTPAVTTLLEVNMRLKSIIENGGIDKEREIIIKRAKAFREFIKDYPFQFVSKSMSNSVTALRLSNKGVNKLIYTMKDNYNIWLCPNGGEQADKVFRVGHIGDISEADMRTLMGAFDDMRKKNILDC